MAEKIIIEPGKYFEITYNLYRVNPDGSETLEHQVEDDDPDYGILGITPGYVIALESALLGMSAGEKFDFYAEPDEAFGPYNPEEVLTVPKDHFLIDGKFDETMFTPGALIPMMTPDGYQFDGLVVGLTDAGVILDINHPLAKNRVHYVGEVTLVREPTEEELKAEKDSACGCGCGGCGCGNNEDGCGEGCGCEGGGNGCGCK